MHLLKLKAGVLLYVAPTMQEGQDTLPMKEIFLDYDPDLWQECREKALTAKQILEDLREKKKLGWIPSRHAGCATKSSRRALDCPLKDVCFNDEEVQKLLV